MLTRKSGMLALVLGVAVFGAACESKDGDIILPTPTPVVTLRIEPDPVPVLNVTTPQSTFQLIAVVSGSATQTANWTSSTPAVATVNATTGLVTAVSAGTTVITAVSTVDATARDAITVEVRAAGTGGGPVGQPTISIQSVTVGATIIPVNPGAVAGRIVATLNVDIPAGVPASAVRVTLNGVEICRQNFANSAIAEDVSASAVPVEIQCPINTAATNADGTPLFPNGLYQGNNSIRAEVVNAAGTVLASATFQPIVLANADFVTATVTTSRGPVMAGGLAWRGGDVTVTLVPTIFTGAANVPTNLSVTLSAFGGAIVENGVCNTVSGAPCGVANETATDANPADGFSVTFSGTGAANGSTTFGAGNGTGVARVEAADVRVSIGGQVASGNPYVGGFVVNMGGAPLAPGTANILRLDNLAPRFTLLDITPATLACGQSACYVNGAFTFAERAGFAATVDYGADAQTTTFAAGPASGSLTTVTNGGQLPETQVAQTNLLAATSTDALQNARTVYATDVAACVTHSSTSVSAANIQNSGDGSCAGVTTVQRFGIDLTPPTLSVASGPANNGANDGTVYTYNFIDVGGSATAGPSGFSSNPLSVKVERITSGGTACFNADGGAMNCALTDADEGTVNLPAGQAYFRTTVFVTDQAGNSSSTVTRMTLIDTTAPVVGGIVAPSVIVGGTSVTLQAAASDNVELGDVKASIGYEGLVTLGFDQRSLASYGPDAFTDNTNIQYSIDQFIWSIEQTTGAGRPSGAISDASVATFDVRDMAGVVDGVACVVDGPSCDVTSQSIDPNVPEQPDSWTTLNTTFASGNAAHGNFLIGAPSPATVCNGGANACIPANQPTSTVLTATVTGPNVTFANPFQRVVFYYIDANGRAQVIGTGAASASDNTITSTRTWTYTASWSVIGLAPMGYQVFALGIDGSGRALMTQQTMVTVEDQ